MNKIIADGTLISPPEFSIAYANNMNLSLCKCELMSTHGDEKDKISLIFFGDLAYYAKSKFHEKDEIAVSGTLKNFIFDKQKGVTETHVLVVTKILNVDDASIVDEEIISSYCKAMMDNNFSFIRKKEIYDH